MAIAYVAPTSALQAIMLLTAAVMPGALTFDRRGVAGWTGRAAAALHKM